MWVKVGWVAALLAAIGIQKALAGNPIHSALTSFVLVFIISYVYLYRPTYVWGEWDPPMHEMKSMSMSDHPESTDLEGGDGDEEINNLLSSDEGSHVNSRQDTPEIIRTIDSEAKTPTKATKSFQPRVERIHFLTNIKIFLTFIVVAFHVAGAFGACGKNFPLVIGYYKHHKNTFQTILSGLAILSQSYFMSLFFFISGYLTPSNYERKGGEQFVKDRARRLLIPALAVTFFLVPLITMVAQWSASFPLMYFPFPEHTWFIYWLLLFEWAYITIRKDRLRSNQPSLKLAFPNTATRCGLGLLLCGIPTYILTRKASILLFWGMPTILPGSLFCDILLFFAGTVANESGWISSKVKIADQIDLPLEKFRRVVLTEGLAIFLLHVSHSKSTASNILCYLVAGMYCIDMSICILQLFQEYANKPLPAFLSDATFTVYLIHTFVITVCTSIFVKIYNALYDDPISFSPENGKIFPVSQSHLSGPMDGIVHYFLGFLVVFIVSNAIVWPAACFVRKLPVLNQYL
jgi:fucose 4-O-acetylase-like acetyltransferase